MPDGTQVVLNTTLGNFRESIVRTSSGVARTTLVAGNIPGQTSTVSLSIFQSVQLGQDGQAYRLLTVSVLLAFLAVWSSEWLMRRKGR